MTPERYRYLYNLARYYEYNPIPNDIDPELEEELFNFVDEYLSYEAPLEDTDLDNAYIDDMIDLRKMER